MSLSYIEAKKIFDFYMGELSKDFSQESQFAQQYANLRLLRLRTKGILDSIESYNIKVTE